MERLHQSLTPPQPQSLTYKQIFLGGMGLFLNETLSHFLNSCLGKNDVLLACSLLGHIKVQCLVHAQRRAGCETITLDPISKMVAPESHSVVAGCIFFLGGNGKQCTYSHPLLVGRVTRTRCYNPPRSVGHQPCNYPI